MSEDLELLLEIVNDALDKVYENDYYLIENSVSERSIVFRFGIYFYVLLNVTEFEIFDLDAEYNRNFRAIKRTPNFRGGTYPDLILHQRGSNENNILIIEFKTWWNRGTDDDLKKLKDFTSGDGEYQYNLGLSILLGEGKPSLKVVQQGEVMAMVDMDE